MGTYKPKTYCGGSYTRPHIGTWIQLAGCGQYIERAFVEDRTGHNKDKELNIHFYIITSLLQDSLQPLKAFLYLLEDKRKIEAAEIRFLRPMTGYTFWDKKEVAT